jgi:phage terminase large subunit
MEPSSAQFPAWSEGLFLPKRIKSIRGGRGSGKSWTVARALLVQAAERKLRILCAREFQNSIQDSVHKLLAEQIDALGLSGFYDVLQTTIRGRNGSEFIFTGLRTNIQSIKSKEGIDRAWIEEAQTVSEQSWEMLIPTIRKEDSEIILTWNPDQEEDPTNQRFGANPPPNCWSVHVNWDANPFFPEVLRAEMEYLYANDPEAAAHVWGGQTRRNSVAQVLRGRYVVESFEPGKDWHGPYLGADWGFSVDPTTLVKVWVHERDLYIEHEAYGVGVDIEDTPALFDTVPRAREHTIRADSARPETISHMRRHGYPRMVGATKGKGSVEDGVEHIRSYRRVVIHPRCIHAAEEARLWSFKVDRLSGDVLPDLKPGNDHIFDGVKYALEPIIRAGKPGKKPAPKPQPPRDYGSNEPRAKNWKTV